jgi:F-type H+-transporting ATPase subunit alpha
VGQFMKFNTTLNLLKKDQADKGRKKNIVKIIKKKRRKYVYPAKVNHGSILSIKDGVARVNGLSRATAGEMVHLGVKKMQGMILTLEYSTVSVVIFGNDTHLKQGDAVIRTFIIMSIPLSARLFGRVIDALGNTVDGKKKNSKQIYTKSRY